MTNLAIGAENAFREMFFYFRDVGAGVMETESLLVSQVGNAVTDEFGNWYQPYHFSDWSQMARNNPTSNPDFWLDAIIAANDIGTFAGTAGISGIVEALGTFYETNDVAAAQQQLGAVAGMNLLAAGTMAIGEGVRGATQGNRGAAPATKVNPLKSGVDFEAQQLAELGLSKNNTVWRPTVEQTQSSAFKVIVGDPKYTKGGLLRGTTLDATEAGLLEIKHGSSVLDSTYQLRLQTFRSLTEGTPYTIRTTRPITPAFRGWLQRWGVKVEGIE